MTPRGRGALVLGLVLVVGAMLAATATVYSGQDDCGSAISAHAPEGRRPGTNAQSVAEDRCDRKITGRHVLAALVGGLGLVIAIAGAVDHERPSKRAQLDR